MSATDELFPMDSLAHGDCPASVCSPVVVDQPMHPYGRMMMCHMMSKDLDALHEMARRIGVARRWFQNKRGGTPHYDVCKSKRALAIQLGAIETDRNGIVEIIRFFREANVHHQATASTKL